MTKSTCNIQLPITAPLTAVFHLYRDPTKTSEPISVQVYLNGFPTAGDIVSATTMGGVPDYANWDVATICQISTDEFDVFLPDDHDRRRRQLVIELSQKNSDQASMISFMSESFAEQLREKEASIKDIKTQHKSEMKNCVSKELQSMRSRDYQYFTSRLRTAKQELENAKLIATLATFDGIFRGLNGIFFRAAEHLEKEQMEHIVTDLEKYNLTCVEDLVKPNPNSTSEEQEAKQSILHILPTDYRGFAQEVYAAQASTKSKMKSTIVQYPQISKMSASTCINRTDIHYKFKEIGRWFIHSNPHTDNGEEIFGSEDATDVKRLGKEVKEIEDIIRGLMRWGDPSDEGRQ